MDSPSISCRGSRPKDARFRSGPIRAALSAGEVAEAAELLGYPWFVSGEVVHGDKRGRELGFPTANLRLDPGCALKHGVYAVRVGVDGRRYDGVATFGRRRCLDTGTVLLEPFLFDFAGDLYGARFCVALIGPRRKSVRFGLADGEQNERGWRNILARAAETVFPGYSGWDLRKRRSFRARRPRSAPGG